MIANQDQIDVFIKAARSRLMEKGCPSDKIEPVLQEALRKEAAYQGMATDDDVIRASAIDAVIAKHHVNILKAAEIVDAGIEKLSQSHK